MGIFDSTTQSTSRLEGYAPAMNVVNSQLGYLGNAPLTQAYNNPYAASMNPMMQQGLNSTFNFGLGGPGAQFAQQMGRQGNQAFNLGFGGLQNQQQQMQAGNFPQFSFDQGLANRYRSEMMPGIQQTLANGMRLNSQQAKSDMGQLLSQAGASGPLGGTPLSKLTQGSAALEAGLQGNNLNLAANLGTQLGQGAFNAGVRGGMTNLNAAQQNQNNLLGLNRGLLNAGTGMQNTGYNAGVRNLGLMNQAGNMQQRFNQFNTDMARQQFMDRQRYPLIDAMGRMNASMNPAQAFGTTYNTTTSTPSLASQIGAVGSAVMGFGSGAYDLLGPGGSMGKLFGGE